MQKSEQLWIYKVNNFFSSFLFVLLGLTVKQSCVRPSCAILGYHLIKREILLKLKIASMFKTRKKNYFQWDLKKEEKIHSSADSLKQAKHTLLSWMCTCTCFPKILRLQKLHILHSITASYTAYGKTMQSHNEKSPTFFIFFWPYTALLKEQQARQGWSLLDCQKALTGSAASALHCLSPDFPKQGPFSSYLSLGNEMHFLNFLSRSTVTGPRVMALI